MASRKGRNKLKSTEKSKESPSIINQYYVSDCTNVMVGHGNTQTVVTEGAKLLDQQLAEKDDRVVAKILNILNPAQQKDPDAMELQLLEKQFNTLYGKVQEKTTFKEITGSNILPFLQKHPQRFILTTRMSRWYVLPKPTSVPSHDSIKEPLSPIFQKGHQKVETAANVKVDELDVERYNLWEEDLKDVEKKSETDEEWFTIVKKRGKRKHFVQAKMDDKLKGNVLTLSEPTSYASIVSNSRETRSSRHGELSLRTAKGSLPISPFVQKDFEPPRDNLKDKEQIFQTFWKEVDFFRKGHFALVTGKMSNLSNAVSVLTEIPWLVIFDLDEHSRDTGLLSKVEEPLSVQRSLHIMTWLDNFRISGKACSWIFIRGEREIPESRFEKGFRDWLKHAGSALSVITDEIARFVQNNTVLKIIVLWSDENAMYINNLLCNLDGKLTESACFYICVDPITKNSDQKARGQLQYLQDYFEDSVKVFEISTENLFLGISYHLSKKAKYPNSIDIGRIPCSRNDKPIDRQGFAWLNECLDVIYITPGEEVITDPDILDDEAQEFFRGGSLKWQTRFAYDANNLDVKRDAMVQIQDRINDLILNFRSGICTLHHAPGSGGSTLAQRVLWELRDTSPCVQIHIESGASMSDIVQRLEYLYEKTHLPIIGLIDGEDAQRIKQLMRSLRQLCIVIFSVKRYAYNMSDKKNNSHTFWLDGHVSKQEAAQLALKFGNFCKEENKRTALKKLSRDVNQGTKHHLYEFGLTAYVHEFKGVRSFVKGYLHLDKSTDSPLQPWQIMLGYFSLVYYYGQSSLPCQFFSTMLGKPSNYSMTIDDFPYEVKQFVVVEPANGRSNDLRICHYFIAKEILEQILARCSKKSERSQKSLSSLACQNLETFALSFIQEASKKKVKTAISPNVVSQILARTFIFRDNQDVGESETHTQPKKRQILSKLLSDVISKPPFTERLHILKKLSQSFPKEPNFHAHLGRFYTLYRPHEEAEAIKAFETALDLCRCQTNSKPADEMDERMRTTLSHIYHMYGMIFNRKVAQFTGRHFGDIPRRATSGEEFEERLFDILHNAEMACERFLLCRESKPVGQEDSFGYVGEITARLQVCDYIHRNSKYSGLAEYMDSERESEKGSVVVDFVERSITTMSDLFLECFNIVDPDDIDTSSFNDAVKWHHILLGDLGTTFEHFYKPDTIRSKRFTIAAKKLKYSKQNNFAVLESVTCPGEVRQIVHFYEEIFEEAFQQGVAEKRALEIDYLQWLDAIRHELFEENRSIETVLAHVRRWHTTLTTPMSKYYLFVLTSLVGFGPNMGDGSSENLNEARNLKDDLRKYGRWVTRSRYPRDWLGINGGEIKQLISNKLYVGNSEGKVQKVSPTPRRSLKVCIGTILSPNKHKVSGFINLDLGNNYVPVHVFFVPLRTEFEGPIHVGKRVEFHLGFSFFNGYEAFNVQPLKKYECIACGAKVEMISSEQSKECSNQSCRELVLKHESF